jgi:hypothetical protein
MAFMIDAASRRRLTVACRALRVVLAASAVAGLAACMSSARLPEKIRSVDTPPSAELASPAVTPLAAAPSVGKRADFQRERPSPQARQLADWVAATRDQGDSEFAIVDKKAARLFVFDASARLRGASPVLLGAAAGDDSVPGIGTRPIAQVQPFERTTPAGRFVAERGRNTNGEHVIWVDYDNAVSMHRVRATVKAERRLQRLATATVADNRISYGCINVPAAFYDRYIDAGFARRGAIVYVLPEVHSMQQVFGLHPQPALLAKSTTTLARGGGIQGSSIARTARLPQPRPGLQ